MEYHAIIPWSRLKTHLEKEIRSVDSQLRTCKPDQLGLLQGRAIQLEYLLNLPETLLALDQMEGQ
jgi:hypothetical protein